MKRLTTALLFLAFTSLSLVSLFPAATLAIRAPEDGASCVALYDGKTLEVGSAKQKAYKDSACSGGESAQCTKTDITKNGKKFIKISCKAPTTTGTTTTTTGSDSGSGESSDGTYQGETITDPALEATCTKDGCDIIDKYVNPAITLMTALVGIAIVIGIIVGGIQVSTSAGDPQKAASGKDHIRNAIIALVAYAVLFAFLQFLIPGGFL